MSRPNLSRLFVFGAIAHTVKEARRAGMSLKGLCHHIRHEYALQEKEARIAARNQSGAKP